MNKFYVLGLTCLVFLFAGGVALASNHMTTGTGTNTNWLTSTTTAALLSTTMTGSEEVPGPGDPNGSGTARVTLNASGQQVCVDMTVMNIASTTGAHIHEGERGVAGPIVVPLPTPDASGRANGCVTATRELIRDIRRFPHEYYVNIHTTEYPNGAIRGQLADATVSVTDEHICISRDNALRFRDMILVLIDRFDLKERLQMMR